MLVEGKLITSPQDDSSSKKSSPVFPLQGTRESANLLVMQILEIGSLAMVSNIDMKPKFRSSANQ